MRVRVPPVPPVAIAVETAGPLFVLAIELAVAAPPEPAVKPLPPAPPVAVAIEVAPVDPGAFLLAEAAPPVGWSDSHEHSPGRGRVVRPGVLTTQFVPEAFAVASPPGPHGYPQLQESPHHQHCQCPHYRQCLQSP